METSPALDAYFTNQETRHYSKGDVLFLTGETPIGVIKLEKGFIKASTHMKNKTPYMHVMYGAGDIFPTYWLFEDGPSPLDYVAVSAVTVKVANKTDFLKRLSTDIRLSNSLSHQIMLQYRSYADRVANLHLRYASERLAYRLIRLSQQYGTTLDDGTVLINAPLTHQIIGNSINLSRESTTRELEKLRGKRIIDYKGRQIVIVDQKGLEKAIS